MFSRRMTPARCFVMPWKIAGNSAPPTNRTPSCCSCNGSSVASVDHTTRRRRRFFPSDHVHQIRVHAIVPRRRRQRAATFNLPPSASGRKRRMASCRFWEHTIRDGDDLNRHFDYVHYNPVKHKYVCCPHAWPHSTFHRFVLRRIATEGDWCCLCSGQDPIEMGIRRHCTVGR